MPRTQSTQGACPGPVLPGVQSCAFPLEPILAHRADPLETLASVSPPVKEESVPGDPWGLSLLGKGSSRLPSARFQTSGSKDSEVCVCRRGGWRWLMGGLLSFPLRLAVTAECRERQDHFILILFLPEVPYP